MKAARILRLYPVQWRDRYGDELEQLVADLDGAGRGRKLRVWADLVHQGLALRLDATGLWAGPAPTEERRRWGLVGAWVGAVALLLGSFALFRYMRGWENYGDIIDYRRTRIVASQGGWRIHGTPTTVQPLAGGPVVLHTLAVAGFSAVAVLVAAGAVPFVVRCARRLRARPGVSVRRPLLGLAAAAALFVAGYEAHRTEWGYRRGGWGYLRAVSVRIGRSTWGISFDRFWQLVFVALTGAALVLAVVSTSKLIRRLDLGPRSWRFETWIFRAVTWVAAASVAVTSAWLIWIAALEPGYFTGGSFPRQVRNATGFPVLLQYFWTQTGVAGTWLWPTLLATGVLIVGSFTVVHGGARRAGAVEAT